ncbi:dihydroneopterin aldolase [Sphingomicrobium nitratireducens]|uniref:dihydroneopterin aldolase n=1 Tax=Sphingomicrobium nitratireducens TaxID=2964666 RepID=UPI002240A0C1|nr:dihydroneopterin aldolase [Sphingomicrobium nitratireducens]
MSAKLDGMVPLVPRSAKIVLDKLEVDADIGFHAHEVGTPQRLLVSVELWLDEPDADHGDDPDRAWNYDFLRAEVIRLATERRYNLQETFLRALFDRIAAANGVCALRIRSVKPDIYGDAEAVGVEIASFTGGSPQ